MARKQIETICENCGKTFTADAYRVKNGHIKNCSRKCSYESRGNKLKTRTETTCERCGKKFFAVPSKLSEGRSRYCSRECAHPTHTAICKKCGKEFRYSPSKEPQFCSQKCANTSEQKSERSRVNVKAAWENPEKRANIIAGIERRSASEEWRSAAHFQKGENHPRYKGNRQARNGASRYEYKKWHRDVLKQCDYTCRNCGKRGGRLEAHHVKPWASNPELRFNVSNGIALCEDCHLSIHGHYRKPITKICIHCGTEFRPKKRVQKYCNQQCFFDAIKRVR